MKFKNDIVKACYQKRLTDWKSKYSSSHFYKDTANCLLKLAEEDAEDIIKVERLAGAIARALSVELREIIKGLVIAGVVNSGK